LYLHGFIVGADGKWCVVQQGMSDARGEARRYHWLSENLESFVDSPHAAIEGRNQGVILNLADTRARSSRDASLDLATASPEPTIALLKRLRERTVTSPPPRAARASAPGPGTTLSLFDASDTAPALLARESLPPAPYLRMPAHHEVRASDVVLKRLHAVL